MSGRWSGSDPSVIVPAIDTASSTAAIRSLGKRGINTVAISEHDSPPGFRSKHCDETVPVPDPSIDLDAYEESVLELLRRDDVETMLPFRESDVYVLARNRETIDGLVGAVWPSLETLNQVQDRVELFAAADRAEVATPLTKTVDQWDQWDKKTIVKPRYTIRATEYADRFSESRTQYSSTRYIAPDETPDPDELTEEMDHVPLAQEFIPTTDEYGFFALYDHGTPVATFQHRQRRGWKYAGGPSAYRESVDIPELETAGVDLLDELGWHGVAMVEFLRDPQTGEFKLMEINPRFWSSLPFTIQAGVDFPHLYLLQSIGSDIEASPDYEVGVAGHLIQGELLHLHSILADDNPLVERPSLLKTLLEIVVTTARHPRFDYFDTSDIGPFLQEVSNGVDEVFPSKVTGSPSDRTGIPDTGFRSGPDRGDSGHDGRQREPMADGSGTGSEPEHGD